MVQKSALSGKKTNLKELYACTDNQVQTEDPPEPPKAAPKKRSLPDWYWVGVSGFPDHFELPSKLSAFVNAVKTSASSGSLSSRTERMARSRSFAMERPYGPRGRRPSIIDQADLLQTNRNSVKRQLVQQFFNKSQETLKPDPKRRESFFQRLSSSDDPEPRLTRDAVKRQVVQQIWSKRRSSVNVILPPSPGVTVKRKDLLHPQSSLESSASLKSIFSSLPFVDEDIEEEEDTISVTKPPQRVLRRSNTDIEMSAATKLGRRLSRRFKADQEDLEAARERKRLRKMWKETYTGMCNRAAVLNRTLEEADGVRPVTNTAAATEIPPSPQAGCIQPKTQPQLRKKRQRYLGLGHPFYHVEDDPKRGSVGSMGSSVETEVQETESPDFSSCRSMLPAASAASTTRGFSLDSVESSLRHADSSSDGEDLDEADMLVMRSCGSSSAASTVPLATVAHLIEARKLSVDEACVETLEPLKDHADFSAQVDDQCTSHPLTYSRSDSPENRPVERAVEARTGSEDGLGSMVRCLHFAHTYIANRKYFFYHPTSLKRSFKTH